MTILLVLIGMLIGVIILYFILKPALKASQVLNEKIITENAEAVLHNRKIIGIIVM